MELPGDTASAQSVTVKVGIGSPRFIAFLVAQFLGTANESAFRVTLILFVLAVVTGETRQVRYSSLATALFPLPFLLVSPLAGFSPIASPSIEFCYGPSRPRSAR